MTRRCGKARMGVAAPPRLLFGVVLVAVLGNPSRAAVINDSAVAMGQNTTIGMLTSTIDNAKQFEKGVFQLSETYKFLMNDAGGCQFRFFQAITSDSEPAHFPGGMAVAVPYVDPVSGGYNYQQAAGGADHVPFFENDDGGKYFYPNYSGALSFGYGFPGGTPVHEQASGSSGPGPAWTGE